MKEGKGKSDLFIQSSAKMFRAPKLSHISKILFFREPYEYKSLLTTLHWLRMSLFFLFLYFNKSTILFSMSSSHVLILIQTLFYLFSSLSFPYFTPEYDFFFYTVMLVLAVVLLVNIFVHHSD